MKQTKKNLSKLTAMENYRLYYLVDCFRQGKNVFFFYAVDDSKCQSSDLSLSVTHSSLVGSESLKHNVLLLTVKRSFGSNRNLHHGKKCWIVYCLKHYNLQLIIETLFFWSLAKYCTDSIQYHALPKTDFWLRYICLHALVRTVIFPCYKGHEVLLKKKTCHSEA